MKPYGILMMAMNAIVLAACGGGDVSGVPDAGAGNLAKTAKAWEQPATPATCAPGDLPEPALQGQVTIMERVQGFKGTRCNLELVGQYQGEGASWQTAAFGDCAYYGQADSTGIVLPVPRPTVRNPGTVVMDVSDPTRPVPVKYLDSASFRDPWESLKVNEPRKLLAAVNGRAGAGGDEFDVYDISDCRNPKLLSSVKLEATGGLAGLIGLKGHEGSWAPDGQTYYGADIINMVYYAIDVRDPAAPRLLARWQPPLGSSVHGLSLNEAGTRGYFVQSGNVTPDPDLNGGNGFYVLDTSEIQARKPDAQFKLVSTTTWGDGAQAQHTLPIFIKGRPYLVHVDELGSMGLGTNATWTLACASGLPPFGHVRLFDITDEAQPKLVSKIMLQTQDPANCAEVVNDNTGEAPFGYDSHYCSVDDENNATTLACGFFASGLRVFDIRDPAHPREIAYYNPPANPGIKAASNFNLSGLCTTTDWVSSRPHFRRDRGEIWVTSHCNGFHVLRFRKGVWPLKGSVDSSVDNADKSDFGGGALSPLALIGLAGAAAAARRRAAKDSGK